MSMKKITMLVNRILSLSLAAALALSSPIVAYAEGDNDTVVVENSVNDNSEEASSSETGRAEDESENSSNDEASTSDDANSNSNGAVDSNDSTENQINNGSDEASSSKTDLEDEDTELDDEDLEKEKLEDELEDKDKECKHEDEFEDVQGTKKNRMLNTTRAALTMMNVVFLPSLLAMGTQSATPAMLATSPIPRNRPE